MSTTTRQSSLILLALVLFLAGPARAAAGVWSPVGPGAGSSEAITSVTVHPASPGAVWAGLPQGGLYRSNDRGINWRWAGGPRVDAIATDPSRPGALWAATATGVFRTENGGSRWTQVSGEEYTAALAGEGPNEVVSVPGILYVVTRRRLLASTDGGQAWEILHDNGEQGWIGSFATHPGAPRTLYLALFGPEEPDLLQSLDGGRTWASVTSCPVPPAGIRQIALAPAAAYVAVEGDEAGLLRSTDRGLTWQAVLGGTRESPFQVVSVAIDPRAPRTLYVSGAFLGDLPESGLWVSRNGGRTWQKAGTRAFGLLRIDSAIGALYAVDQGKLWRSLDGGATWTMVLRAPHPESSFAQIAFRPNDPARRALSVGFTLYRSINSGRTWKLASSLWGVRDVDLDPEEPDRLVAVTASSAYVSENAGRTWQPVTGPYDFWYVELLARADQQTLIAGGAGLYRSGDNGQTWQTVLPGWPAGSDIGRWTQKIEVDFAHPAQLYALTFLAEVLEPPHDILSDLPSILWKSVDGGRTWRKRTLNLRTFAFDSGSSRLVGVRGRQVLSSIDGGKSWNRIGRTPYEVHELVIDPRDPDVFYAAGRGLWRSRNRGATWELVNGDWTPATLTFDLGDPRILYGADRWSVFQMKLPG